MTEWQKIILGLLEQSHPEVVALRQPGVAHAPGSLSVRVLTDFKRAIADLPVFDLLCAKSRKERAMRVTTGLRQVTPFGEIEWVDVRSTKTPDRYCVICDPHKFEIAAANDAELLERITRQLHACLRKAP